MFLSRFLLCFLQGVMEFLPISSSAHLILITSFLNLPHSLTLCVALHLGTLIAIVCYFYHEIIEMLSALWHSLRGARLSSKELQSRNLFFALFVATIPTVIVGFIVKKLQIDLLLQKTWIMGLSSIFFGILLYIADKKPAANLEKISIFKGALIGMLQSLAFIPGASRSGLCITMGRLLKIDRFHSIHFSFLLAIPVILGAVILTAVDLIENHTTIDYSVLFTVVGVTAIISMLTINLILNFMQKYGFTAIAFYRIILGIIILIFYWTH
jgi:undecaprenyl-diphosphatase